MWIIIYAGQETAHAISGSSYEDALKGAIDFIIEYFRRYELPVVADLVDVMKWEIA